jgi:aldose 1-epimerase
MDLPSPLPLKGRTLDDGFIDLQRDSLGRAHFSIEAAGRTVEAIFGPKYPVAVVWEPGAPAGQTRDFICFEPMTAITSVVNLAHDGKYGAMQSIAAGERWTESFWVRAGGM